MMKCIQFVLFLFIAAASVSAQEVTIESKPGGWSASKPTTKKPLAVNVPPSDVDIDIPNTGTKNPDAIAVIFGIEDYKRVSKVPFAARDAEAFKKYAVGVLGVTDDKNHIYYETNDNVTKTEFEKVFASGGWLSKRVTPKSDVYVYYAGHGAPDAKDKKAYLVPVDADGNYIAQSGYPLDQLYLELGKLKAKSITVFIDACFSGELVEGKRALPIPVQSPSLSSDKITVFSAASGTQTSNFYPEKGHGIFTYYLLKALRGDAAGKDNMITVGELEEYLNANVSKTAGQLDSEQTPEVKTKDKSRLVVKLKK